MAEGDKGKNIVVVGEGEGEGEEETNISPFPPGFRFAPTDDELVEYYLLPRLQGRPHVPNAAIIDDYVYQCHPDDLTSDDKYKDRGQDDTWYFLSSRERKYLNGDRPSRSTEDGRGRWKASTGSKAAVTGGGVEYTFSTLNYYDGPIKKEDKGKWMMRELTVPEYENKIIDRNGGHRSARDTLDEYVMCKIYETTREPKNKNKGDEAGTSGTCEDTCPSASQPDPAENSSSQEPAKPKPPERRKRKRPVEAATPKQEPPAPAHRCLGPPPPQGGPSPAQFYGGATQARFGPTAYQHHQYAGTGRPPMAYNPHTAMPRPRMAFNPHAAMPRPPVAFTGQVAPYQAAPAIAPGAYDQATMMRRLGPPPRPPTVPRYPVMQQRPPETDEMRRNRVYQQHLTELMRMRGNGMMQQQQQAGNAAYAAQQPLPMAFMLQQQQKQQPYFGHAGFNHQYVRPMGPQFLPCGYHQPVEEVGQQVQYTYAVPDYGAAAATPPAETEAGIVGATNEGIDIRGDCSNGEENSSVEDAATKVLPDGRTAPADSDGTRQDPPR